VGVADVFVAQQSFSELGQKRVTHESELNHCSVGSAGAKTLIH
jgi:hypothetical protein